jgi:hypothetical protein
LSASSAFRNLAQRLERCEWRHRGDAGCGHYGALIRETDNFWYLYDDENVYRVCHGIAEALEKCNVAHEVARVRYSLL